MSAVEMLLASGRDMESTRSLVFGELVKIAAPVMVTFHSDLFHDATWLQEHMTGREFEFYWSVNHSGTSIGTDRAGARREHVFHVRVWIDVREVVRLRIVPD